MENDVNAVIAFVVVQTLHPLLLIVLRKTEGAHADLEAECSLADRRLHESEASLSSLRNQLKAKQQELNGKAMSRSVSS
jgi:hypothetical protein